MLGSAEQVLKQAVYFAAPARVAPLKPGSRDCSPEAYIRRIRRLIETMRRRREAAGTRPSELPRRTRSRSTRRSWISRSSAKQRYGEWFARVALSNERRNLIFDFADRFPDLRGWQLAAVGGLPAS